MKLRPTSLLAARLLAVLVTGALLTQAAPAYAEDGESYLSVGDWQEVRVPAGSGTTVHALPVSAHTTAPPPRSPTSS